MAQIKGIGWITGGMYGCVKKGVRTSYHDKMALRGRIFLYPFKNFGRLDGVSVMLCHAVSLALMDACIVYGLDSSLEIGIIGANKTGKNGCLKSDIMYFRDYLDGGRRLARGALFIYTLPSSPLGEAAIHFGLKGPLLHVSVPESGLSSAVSMAADMVSFDGIPMMLACLADEQESICLVVEGEAGMTRNTLCATETAISIIGANHGVAEMMPAFSRLIKEERDIA
jgi:3-oxoacyl-[acyl-carrier-protein] synthase II